MLKVVSTLNLAHVTVRPDLLDDEVSDLVPYDRFCWVVVCEKMISPRSSEEEGRETERRIA